MSVELETSGVVVSKGWRWPKTWKSKEGHVGLCSTTGEQRASVISRHLVWGGRANRMLSSPMHCVVFSATRHPLPLAKTIVPVESSHLVGGILHTVLSRSLARAAHRHKD